MRGFLILLAIALTGCGHAVDEAEPPPECQVLLDEKEEHWKGVRDAYDADTQELLAYIQVVEGQLNYCRDTCGGE